MVLYFSYGHIRDPARDPAPRRDFSRVTGHHNAIDEDPWLPSHLDFSISPPSYRTATERGPKIGSDLRASDKPQVDVLPQYECTIAIEGSAGIKYEQTTPFDSLEDKDWSEVYLKLYGTCLSVHQLGSVGKLSKALGSPKADWPGRLIKTYTLQQAEAGLASDAPKHELLPTTLAAALWPHSKIKRLQEESPHLFDHVRQYVIRLRLETEQLVIRFKKWEDRAQWIDQLCKAIDIASPLEYRTEPKYHTLPRRRRQRPAARSNGINALTNMASLIEEQERIMRERFPHLLGNNVEDSGGANDELADVAEDTAADPEAEDLDNTVVMVNSNRSHSNARAQPYDPQQVLDQTFFVDPSSIMRPAPVRTNTNSASTDPSEKPMSAEIDANQVLRWRRRCMPTLLYTSRRCNDILIKDGKLWKINWDSRTLMSYPEAPPKYEPPSTFTAIQPIVAENYGDSGIIPDATDNVVEPEPVDVEATEDLEHRDIESNPSARPSESNSRALRPTPSTTTVDDSAESSLNTLDSRTNPSTGPSKLWVEMKGWGKRIRKQRENEPQSQRPATSTGSVAGSGLLLKIGGDESNFGEDTLRVLGIP